MAPGSRGVRVVFLRFSSKDSGQTGDDIGESRVARRSQCCPLSLSSKLGDQIAVSWEDFVCEDGFSQGKMCQISNTLFLLSLIFSRMVDVVPDVGFS